MRLLTFIRGLKIRSAQLVALAFLLGGFVTLSVKLQGGGLLLYGEADWFLIDHNTPERSFVSKILAPHRHDAEQYLARETTHLVEHIDARFIHWCVMRGYPHFMSVMTYVFLCGVATMLWVWWVKRNQCPWVGLFLLAVYLTATPILLAGTYVRPGHAHATFWAVALLIWLIESRDRDAAKMFSHLGVVFGLSLAAVWADRQGLFATAAMCLFVLIREWKTTWGRLTALMMVWAALVHSIYYLAIGPRLIAAFTEFQVGKAYQMDVVTGLPSVLAENFGGGLRIATANLVTTFGHLAPVATLVLFALFVIVWNRFWIPLYVFGMVSVMSALVMFHQKAYLWPDLLHSVYYNIIGVTFLFIVGAMSIGMIFNVTTISRLGSLIILAILSIGNLSAVGAELTKIRRGHLVGYVEGAPYLREALRLTVAQPDGKNPKKYNVKESMHYVEFKWIMKNSLNYGGKLSALDFVNSSQYLNWIRSNKGLPFEQKSHE